MFYDFAVVVPLNTLESAPVIEELQLTYGVIHTVRVLFPPGPHGMVKLRLLHQESSFVPTNPDGYLCSDDEAIVIDEYFELLTAPYTLKAVAWSPNTDYPHTLSIRVGILDPEEIEPLAGLSGALKKIAKFFGIGM